MKAIHLSLKTVLIGAIALLLALHVLYYTLSQKPVFQGIYFASGEIISSTGNVFSANQRLQSHGRQVHQFEQINEENQKYTLKLLNGLAGSGRFIIDKDEANQRNLLSIDRDISFNQTFFSTAMSELTLYKLDNKGGSLCFYLKELSSVRCFGPE
ncbi:hypothetical protein HDC30_002466 [Pseudomonas sp. JAI115]|uniref:hypothetical protein n=1 Tax=Pseudomonas sp. JAI115 TaxID=2723061 RepID=UPI001611498C|nr:hypothetical protein [Pseudomonas sp. JAI115]MBB6155243.1 hypothetical protein [Pseudomonas sp. JAI115]